MNTKIRKGSIAILFMVVMLIAYFPAVGAYGKEVRPATVDDFADVWIGYDGGGNFLRIILNKDKLGSCVLIHPYDHTMESYDVTIEEIVPRQWSLRLRFTPVSGQFAEPFEAAGTWDWYRLKMTAKGGQGRGWKKGLEVLREKDLTRYVQMAKENKIDSARPASEESPVKHGKAIFHVVEKGEDLNTIAEMYGVTVEALAKANGITNWIRIGQELEVPVGAKQ